MLARFNIVTSRIKSTANLFSIRLLISTLFAPYKQIAAEYVDGPIGIRMRAFFDRLFSRIIGAIVRLFMIVVGTLIMALQAVMGLVIMTMWLFIPTMPVVGLLLWVVGWLPL